MALQADHGLAFVVVGAPVSAAATPAALPSRNNALLVEGLSATGLFTAPMVKALAAKLVDFQKNGSTVVVQ